MATTYSLIIRLRHTRHKSAVLRISTQLQLLPLNSLDLFEECKEVTVRQHDLYHGSTGDRILAIIQQGVMRPNNGVLFFGRFESQYHHLFRHGTDRDRGACYVIKVRVHLPDGAELKQLARSGAPVDSWTIEVQEPLSCQVLELYVRPKGDGEILKVPATKIPSYLGRNENLSKP